MCGHARAQATYLIDPSGHSFAPEWLEPDTAEELRSSVEARKLLQEEFMQVCACA